MDTFLEALGYVGQITAILAQLKAAEKAGQAQVALPPIYVHHHTTTWELDISATKSTQTPKPKP